MKTDANTAKTADIQNADDFKSEKLRRALNFEL